MQIPDNIPVSKDNAHALKQELDAFLAKFSYEKGAVLIQIPQLPSAWIEKEVARNRGYFAYPPLGLLYLSAILHQEGIKTHIVDLNFIALQEAQKVNPEIDTAWQQALNKALSVFVEPFVCVSLMYDATYAYFKQVCGQIRRINPESCIACGGVSATANAARIINERAADMVFSYEGQQSLKHFYGYLRKESPDLPLNISFLGSGGAVLETPKLPGANAEIDIRQEYASIPIKDYCSVGSVSNYSRMNGKDIPFAALLTRSGCRGGCSFCGVRNFYGKGVRVRSVESVIREMDLLYHTYGIRHFDWVDDDLLFDEEKAVQLFDQMAQCFPDITWAVNNGLMVAAITPEILRSMDKSGCIGFKVGLESGNASILRRMHKPLTLEKFFNFAKMFQEFPRMHAAVNLILGFPDETFDQILDSYKAALRSRLDWYNFYIYQPIKNTELSAGFGKPGFDPLCSKPENESQGPAMNPVRGRVFANFAQSRDVLCGYDIMDIRGDTVPEKRQLQEIWFTLNFITNFLRMPALFTDSEIRLRHNIRWMEALSQAYPLDAAMTCVVYYLKQRLGIDSRQALDKIRSLALAKIRSSEYWQYRDQQFLFSSFLEQVVPVVPQRYLDFDGDALEAGVENGRGNGQ